ncbi:TIGR02646 family protein [Nostoc sp. 'Peltigera membranacea cyanobiont' 210A]|uniref:retron system putative HNH endonuclease n=1 Tax=Nostoc sp. 'Peltigera membranacea cyanobiont' 210A TaxID=2014529 RepID=UPI000B95B95D|nr:retron system putative HNH endonuclease [Nostoc sp. 'Peltigera membranacea cyanobiont' 210A]OYD92394.1 TIGR02646 family protein [Nostoc sp. 'Peltigera membranacea cyanobiont' 210A]
MKHIAKGSEPKELCKWFESAPIDDHGKRINCSYENGLPSDIRRLVQYNLLKEQGWLCCYTGIRISEERSHIEHFKPQSLCRKEGNYEDVNYNNLLAAYPKGECQFGARARHNWYDADSFISPLDRQCETKFIFDMEGHIKPADDRDKTIQDTNKKNNKSSPANITIKKLELDHDLLIEMRREAINEVFFSENKKLSEAKLRTIVENGYSHRDRQGRYPHFCFVIEQVAQELLRKTEQNRRRREAIHRQSHQ